MKIDKRIKLGMLFVIGILLMSSFVLAYYRTQTNYVQYGPYSRQGSAFMAGFDKEAMCKAGQDFILQIAPFGCEPAPVRSDLLEEQNVPVFCQIVATNMNPLVDVEAIDYISFTGEYPKEVSTIGFHPAKGALGTKTKLNSPVLNNIGYVVIVLKRQPNESAMPDVIEGNLTARIRYDIKNAFGIGRANFYLPVLEYSEWEDRAAQYSFWDGRGYLMAEGVDEDSATISIYSSESIRKLSSEFGGGIDYEMRRLSTVDLKVGETSRELYIPGFDYCLATLQLKLDGVESPDTRARLNINGEIIEVAEKEKFLDNRCWVVKIDKKGLNKKVTIRCKKDNLRWDTFDLEIVPKVILNISGEEKEVGIGDYLYEEEGKRAVYLGYMWTREDTGNLKDLLLYLVAIPETDKGRLSDEQILAVKKLAEQLVYKKRSEVGLIDTASAEISGVIGGFNVIIKRIVKGMKHYITSYSAGEKEAFGKKVRVIGFAGAQDIELDEKTKEYFDDAMGDYETIVESFAGEEYEIGTFGEEALYEMIMLADGAGQKIKLIEFCEDFRERYPDSEKNSLINGYCDNELKISNSKISSRDVMIDGDIKRITLDGIYEPNLKEYGAEIKVKYPNGQIMDFTLGKEDIVDLDESKNEYMQLIWVKEDSVKIKTNVISAAGQEFLGDERILRKGFTESFGDYVFTLSEVNLEKVAKVSVIPNIDYARTETDFKFKIEIEKRAIQLSPDKAKQKIENLNENIDKWEKNVDRLGFVVKRMKEACLATGGWMVTKNFFANVGGKGIARHNIMRGEDGWYERCGGLVSKGVYDSEEQCFLDKADAIDSDVDLLYNLIEEQNKDIKNLQGESDRKFLSENVIDTDKLMQRYAPQVQSGLSSLGNEFEDVSGFGEAIDMNKMNEMLSYEGWKDSNNYDREQLREIELYTNVLSSDASDDFKLMAKKRLYSLFTDIKVNSEGYLKLKNFGEKYNAKESFIGSSEELKDKFFISDPDTFGELNTKNKFKGSLVSEIDASAYAITYKDESSAKEYLLTLDGDYVVTQTYLIGADGTLSIKEPVTYKSYFIPNLVGVPFQTTRKIEGDVNPLRIGFEKYDSTSYENKYKNPEARFFESGPYAGYPAILPFDLKNGWYAVIRQTLPVFGGLQAYEKSGRVMSFYLCNVGKNGLEQNMAYPDDICEMINFETGQPYNQFPGITDKTQASNLVRTAKNAIEDAQKQRNRKPGLDHVTINGQRIKVGAPAANIPGIQCQDFMSPKDCQVLFNVCDPVVCPSSRCDFGGTYPVKDVVQSGIIGSIALCLPNFREGIYVPVCLTGIHAGIENLLSVQKAYRDCLQQSLDTGETIGICDEIHSIYLCEFFWRQSLPLARFGIPRVASWILNQNSRGGGEYLGVLDAWANTEKSIAYFTQYYAANSYKAFKARTAEDVGGEICKNFASLRYPKGGNLLDAITSPDSPPQFSGRFDEIPFTTVTNPPISHYKVFYHIYAGKDSGAYYRVYLRGGSGSSFYQDTSIRVIVATGYIGRGDYISETRDFTAPSGYKEMCIVVNGQEECGFKQVSTTFAVNYVKDMYMAEQAEATDIRTEEECISGTASLYSLLNPNVQEGLGEMINPAIYNRGIIRICATDNPGKGTDASRWDEVGKCGANMKCWLDRESVENVIKAKNIEEEVLNKTAQNYMDILKNEGNYFNDEGEFNSMIEEIEEEEDLNRKLNLINSVFDKAFYNNERAYLLLLRGRAYGDLAIGKYSVVKSQETESKGIGEEIEGEIPEERTIWNLNSAIEKVKTLRGMYSDNKEFVEQLYEDGILTENEYKSIKGGEGIAGWFMKERTMHDLKILLLEKKVEQEALGGLEELRQDILSYAEGKEGELLGEDCFDAVYKLYQEAGAGKKCVYSEYYSTQRSQPACTPCGCEEESGKCFNCRRDQYDLEQGDLIQVYNANLLTGGHNLIFVEWVNEPNKIANCWDQETSTGKIRFREDYDLVENPITVIWEPVHA